MVGRDSELKAGPGLPVWRRWPPQVARFYAGRGIGSYEMTLQGLREVPYSKWRDIDVADSLRFWALRMYDVGAIKSSPQQIIARGTDFRFLNELKKELKA